MHKINCIHDTKKNIINTFPHSEYLGPRRRVVNRWCNFPNHQQAEKHHSVNILFELISFCDVLEHQPFVGKHYLFNCIFATSPTIDQQAGHATKRNVHALVPFCDNHNLNLLGYATQRHLRKHHTHTYKHRNENYHIPIYKHIQMTYSNNTHINVEIIVRLHIHHIKYIQALLISYITCKITQHVNEHRSDTYLLIEYHQLRAYLPRTS